MNGYLKRESVRCLISYHTALNGPTWKLPQVPNTKISLISWVSYSKVSEWVYALAVWRVSHTKVSGVSRTLFAGTTNAPTGIIKTNDTTSRLLSLSVVMVRVGAVRQRLEIARQTVPRYASLLETARIELTELQALQQEVVRQSRQQWQQQQLHHHHQQQHHQRQQCVWNVVNVIVN